MDHTKEFLALVDDAMARIKEITVEETLTRLGEGAMLIDVREDNEFVAGHASNAVHIGRGIIERDIIGRVPDRSAELILYCGGGFRSALAADNLQKMGYSNVYSLAGGWRAWNEAGEPVADQKSHIEQRRARARALAAEFADRGEPLGWFDTFYAEAAGNNENIPWADLEPNRFFKDWAERVGLKGDGRKALVVGCGLGDDAAYLADLGFEVTAFDLSPTAIDWARKLYADRSIQFEVGDLFSPFRGWLGAFDFVLEIYTIQPIPFEMRKRAIDSVAQFPAPGGELVVVTRGREDDEELTQLPWPLSRQDLSRFQANGLVETFFNEVWDDEDEARRFVVGYRRPEA